MFQNIAKDFDSQNEDVEFTQKENKIKMLCKKIFTKQTMVLYIISLMLSMVGFQMDNTILSIAPFGVAMLAASMSAGVPIGVMYVITLIGTMIKFGGSGLLLYVLTTLVFFGLVLVIRPRWQEVNERRKLGIHLFAATFVVQACQMFFRSFYVYDLLYAVMLAISVYIFYKIFVNSVIVIQNWGIKKAFSIEEVIGSSLLLAISFSVFGGFTIFGFSIKNILSILLVLILGWKNGILVGATSGVTIGVVLGIIGNGEPIMVASYALSGMIAGIFNRLGKIGVIVGFILGNVLLTYVANGNTVPIIMFQEILIASLGLLAIPKSIRIDIEDLFGKTKLLPESSGRVLEENQNTILKLNNISETISEMAKSYGEAAATIVTDEELERQELENEKIFALELQNNLNGQEDNMLYDDLSEESDIVKDIFKKLIQREVITNKDIIEIFANYNNYIMGFDEETNHYVAKQDLESVVKAVNSAYHVSKLNFIWKKKLDENKKTVSSQLEGVSEAISSLAEEITPKENEEEIELREEIKLLLQQKEIYVKDLIIKQEESGRYIITLYTDVCENVDGKQCGVKKIAKILSKILEQPMVIQKQRCGLRLDEDTCMYTYLSEDLYTLQVGIAKSKKADSPISGDSSIQTKLEDGKYLLALSDGMGSGPDARKSSKIAIKMLERLLTSGFEKDTSLKLINSTLSATSKEDMYATLDIQILDLYKGNMEFIKNGACPTYVKRGKEVQLLKSISLPTGILDHVDLVVYDKDLEDGDILIMCSDGIIDSNSEYANKELWIKYLLEDLETDDVQRIADIILSESIDNDFGKEKDDMTVMVARVVKK